MLVWGMQFPYSWLILGRVVTLPGNVNDTDIVKRHDCSHP